MKTCVYKIQFDKNSFDLNDDDDRLSEVEKERISDLDAETFYDYEKDGNYTCFVITTPVEMKKYISILTNNLIICDCQDISSDVLKFKLDLEEELRDQISTINSIKYSFFIDDIYEWIKDNREHFCLSDSVRDDLKYDTKKSLSGNSNIK
jgi:hypothetical protein